MEQIAADHGNNLPETLIRGLNIQSTIKRAYELGMYCVITDGDESIDFAEFFGMKGCSLPDTPQPPRGNLKLIVDNTREDVKTRFEEGEIYENK